MMDEQALPEYTAEKLAENFPNRVDPLLLSGPYTPIYRARAEIDRLRRENERLARISLAARRLDHAICEFGLEPPFVVEAAQSLHDLLHGSSPDSASGDFHD